MGGQVEESDEVEVVERRYVIKRHKRKKYRCRCGSCIETAPAPRKLIEGGRYSVNFAITVAVDKYLMHLPLERQVAAMARLGLEVDSQTLFDQLWALNRLLLPAYQRLADEQRACPLLFVDESRWPLLGVKGKGAASTKWHIWTLVSDLGVYYEIYDGRDADSAEDLLAGFQGYVMCDGFSVYEALAKAYPEIRLVQCWVMRGATSWSARRPSPPSARRSSISSASCTRSRSAPARMKTSGAACATRSRARSSGRSSAGSSRCGPCQARRCTRRSPT
ncbi:MAG: transposase [Byssovorax sp.]